MALPCNEKNDGLFIRLDTIPQRDGRTDGPYVYMNIARQLTRE